MTDSVVVLMFIAILFVGLLMLAVIAMSRGQTKRQLDQEFYQRRIEEIEALLKKGEASSNSMAILNADKLLDSALRERRFRGNTMAERLKSASSTFRNRDSIWSAHKLRNRIAHEDGVVVGDDQAQRALNTFKSGLRDLGALR